MAGDDVGGGVTGFDSAIGGGGGVAGNNSDIGGGGELVMTVPLVPELVTVYVLPLPSGIAD